MDLLWMVSFFILGSVFVLIVKNVFFRLFFVSGMLCFLGFFLYVHQTFIPVSGTVKQGIHHTIRVSGVIDEEVTERVSSQEVILNGISLGDQSVFGRLLVRLPLYPEVRYGQKMIFTCDLENPEPFNGFAYDRLLASRGIYVMCAFPEHVEIQAGNPFVIKGFLLNQKHFFLDSLKKILGEPHATFVSGLLFGGSASFSQDLRDDFSRTGMSHIMAASGYNVAIFSYLLLIWLQRSVLGKRRALFAVGFFVVFYVVLAGATPSVIRAGMMAVVTLVGLGMRRPTHSYALLVFVAALMLLQNPTLLFDDVGFQLSFLATVGLLIGTPQIEGWFVFLPKRFGIQEAFVSSVCASVFTLPILLWHFGSVSFIAPFVNVIILPLIPYLMFFGFVAMMVGWMGPFMSFISFPAWAFSSLTLHFIEWFGSLSFASVSVPAARMWSGMGVVIIVLFMRQQTKNNHEAFVSIQEKKMILKRAMSFAKRKRYALIFSLCIPSCLFIFSFLFFLLESHQLYKKSGELQIWFFDVGQGDAIFIQTPTGEQMLIDSGRDTRVLSKLSAVMMPWDKHLDAILLTHPDSDHMTGFLEILRRYEVDRFYETGIKTDKIIQASLREEAQRQGVGTYSVQDSSTIMMGDLSLHVLAPEASVLKTPPEDTNQTSIVLLLSYQGKKILFTGDLPTEMEYEILPDIKTSIDLLQVPHHGSVYSTSKVFLEKIQPLFAVISVGEKNGYGHPHPVLLKRLAGAGVKIFRTDKDGDIFVKIDERGLRVLSSPLPF